MSDPELDAQTAPTSETAPKWHRKSRAKAPADRKKAGRPVTKPPKDPNAPKRKIGRPPMLTDERKKVIIGLIASGNYMATSADYVGVSVDVVDDALRRGRSAFSGPDFDFRVAVNKAHALWTAGLVAATTQAASRNPTIALQMLSRRAKGWSDKPEVTIQHTGAIGSFDVTPSMGEAVRSDPASNAAFLELLGKLSESGAFDPGGPLSSTGAGESSGPGDDREPRPIQIATASGATKL